ncbi:hypothetical protein ACLESO_15290 [Pyxidicoccus sp. 3LG]
MRRLFFSKRAERQRQRLPREVRVHVETHLENLALLLDSGMPLSRVLARLERTDDGFVSKVEGARLSLALDTATRIVLVVSVEPVSGEEQLPGLLGGQGLLPAT